MPAPEPTASGKNPWIVGRLAAGEPRVRLICLAQAGGGPGAFAPWRPHLPDGVELAPVQLPARGIRDSDPMPERFEDLVEDLWRGLAPELTMPYVLFGHSFGALLAYEVTCRVQQRGGTPPRATVISACRAPHIPLARGLSDASDDALLAWLVETDGLPAEVLGRRRFATRVIRAVRMDMRFAERYHVPTPTPVLTPLLALGGEDDDVVPSEQVGHWKECAAAEFRHRTLPGGHSFPQRHPAEVMEELREVLLPLDRPPTAGACPRPDGTATAPAAAHPVARGAGGGHRSDR